MTKSDLRKRIRAQRDAMDSATHALKSQAICRHLLSHPAFCDAKTVFLTLSFGSEFDTRPLVQGAWAAKKTVLTPVALPGRRMELVAFGPDTPLAQTAYGLWEVPPGSRIAVDPEEVDFCLIPGLVFDPMGGRIGYGGGYYDSFLPSLAQGTGLVAAAFDLQVLPGPLPMDPHDFPVPELWTESGLIFQKTPGH